MCCDSVSSASKCRSNVFDRFHGQETLAYQQILVIGPIVRHHIDEPRYQVVAVWKESDEFEPNFRDTIVCHSA